MTDALLNALVDAVRADEDVARELADALAPFLNAPVSQDDDRWLDTQRAADYLAISKHALHKLTAARAIRFEQDCPNGKCYFTRADLDAYRRGGRS